MKKKLLIPKFVSEDEEHEFWMNIDLSDYFNSSDFRHFDLEQFLNDHKEPTTTRITIRIPTEVLRQYRKKALELDIPYQSLMKQQLAKVI